MQMALVLLLNLTVVLLLFAREKVRKLDPHFCLLKFAVSESLVEETHQLCLLLLNTRVTQALAVPVCFPERKASI